MNTEAMKRIVSIERLSGMEDADIYRDLLACFEGTPYVWGGSKPEGSDCSGSVCCALNMLYGKNIRVTANVLFHTYFTEAAEDDQALGALFFLDSSGKAVHVAGRMSDQSYMNVSRRERGEIAAIRTYCQMLQRYSDFRSSYRSLKAGGWV